MTTLILMLLIAPMINAQDSVAYFNPAKDNTLIETPLGNSNGSGNYFYVGKTGSTASKRRGLLYFDLGNTIPAGSVIDSVSLTLNMSQASNDTARIISVYGVTQHWGEDSSFLDGGKGDTAVGEDATWTFAYLDSVSWNQPGGDFDTTVITSTPVGGDGNYVFHSTPEFTQLVQNWLDSNNTNFGLILLGDEETNSSVKRFGSHENPDSAQVPVLTVYHRPKDTLGISATTLLSVHQPTVYPNPSDNVAWINFNSRIPTYWELTDITGKQIPSSSVEQFSDKQLKINTKQLNSGVYFLKAEYNRNISITKIIVDHE